MNEPKTVREAYEQYLSELQRLKADPSLHEQAREVLGCTIDEEIERITMHLAMLDKQSINIIPIRDIDEFMAIEEEAQRQAAEHIQPWQRDLKPGDLFYRNHPCGITIFGEVLQIEAGEDDDEPMPDYRLTRCFSEVLPEGEMGEIHISTVAGVLTAEEFAAAKARGWKLAS